MKLRSNLNNNDTSFASDGVNVFRDLRVTSTPSNPQDVANKAYVDKVAITDKYLAGDILIRPTSTTPTGFLKCNGSELDKIMYSALYAAIGDTHDIYSVPGAGTPWRNQYGINTVLNAPLTDWVGGNSLNVSNMGFLMAVTKNRVYIFGRNNNATSSTNAVYTATIAADGTISTWTTSSVTLPTGITRAQIFTYLGKIYIVGGNNSSDQANAWRCNINADGTITSFTAMTALPFTVAGHQCAPIQNKVFLCGGYQNGTISNAVYCALIDSNGNFGTWYNSATNPALIDLPYAVTGNTMTLVNRRGYLIGGLIDGTTATNNVYYSEFDDAGNMSQWKMSAPLPETFYNGSVIVSTDKIYVLGGVMSGAYSNKVYFADIRADGSLGTWSSGGTLPDTIASGRTALTYGKIYIMGGFKGGATALLNTYFINLPGGLNDYSPYYNGTYNITPPDKFRIPQYTSVENKYYFFIKY